MDDRVVQFRVGVMVLASLLITGILVVLFGELPRFAKRIFQPTYTVHLWFPEGRGLTEDALVRRNGIVVGRVTDIGFAAEEEDLQRPAGVGQAEFSSGILVTVDIEKKSNLYKNDVCRVETDLLGKPSLQFLRPEGKPPTTELLDTAQLQRGEIAPNPLDSLSTVTNTLAQLAPNVNAASKAIANAGDTLNDAAKKVTSILDEETQAQIRTAIARTNQSLEAIQNIVGDKQTQEELRTALRELPEGLRQMKTTMEKAQMRLDDMEPFTKKLGSPETVDRLDRATRRLDQVMGDLAAFSESLKKPQGSLGLLLQDRQLYDHLNRAAENVDNLTQQLEPIVKDVRIFTDKIARHPERLGAQGVLQRYPGIK
jgi:phospholipid/cholesterol/gamma-HCH transport system substrate-binding protein